jgi:hypothetical protein
VWGTPTATTTIASGAIAMVEDDHNLFGNDVRAIDRVRVTYAPYDEVILLRFGSVTSWPAER